MDANSKAKIFKKTNGGRMSMKMEFFCSLWLSEAFGVITNSYSYSLRNKYNQTHGVRRFDLKILILP